MRFDPGQAMLPLFVREHRQVTFNIERKIKREEGRRRERGHIHKKVRIRREREGG